MGLGIVVFVMLNVVVVEKPVKIVLRLSHDGRADGFVLTWFLFF